MSNKFFWYSKSSKETGALLAKRMGFGNNHGTLPPRDFMGVIVCWGASPGKEFKWESRNIRALMNDPRKVKKLTDRKIMFDKLAEAGVSVISCVPLAEAAQYNNLCNILAVDDVTGFIVCKISGARSRRVSNQAELVAAMAEGCSRALDDRFTGTNKVRLFIVNGEIVSTLKKGPGINDATFIARAALEAATDWENYNTGQIQAVLTRLLEKNLVTPGASFWTPCSIQSEAKKTAALTTANALGLNFCAVDIEAGPDSHDVINVVTTPDLVSVDAQKPVAEALSAWVSTNSMTAKQLFQALADDSTEDEAAAILSELRSIKSKIMESNAS